MFKQLPINKYLLVLTSIAFLLLASTGCKRKLPTNYRYFQNAFDTTVNIAKTKEYKFKIDDVIAIYVIAGSIKQDDASLFNAPISGALRSGSSGTYKVDSLGFITMPKIGKIQAVGSNRDELAKKIETLLVDEVKQPIVSVRLDQFRINILGEVRKPGPVFIRSDKANIIDAIAEAGDVSDYGMKDEILLMRLTDGKYETYKVDLTKVAFINSPAFQVFPEDIIYVTASPKKNRLSDDRANFIRELSLVISSVSIFISALTSLGVLKRN